MAEHDVPAGMAEALRMPLVQALLGRRARRFAYGATIPDGVFAFASLHDPFPLSELERALVLMAVTGNTGWHYLIMRNARYAPYLPNYSAAAGGRTFPSAAGFHTSEIFFTDDSGTYFLPTRDSGAWAEHDAEGEIDPDALLAALHGRMRRLTDHRLVIPHEDPYIEGHNTWCVNIPGTLLIIPVGDLAQHVLAALCYYLQNGYVIYDDVRQRAIPGLAQFSEIVDPERAYPLSFVETLSLAELTAEMSTACYAGMLMLQALGLGGWMFDGMDPFSVLGASGSPDVPGLGFRYDTDQRWPLPNPTGLPGVFEAFCPPHYPDMRAAVEALVARKFGPGGPFHQQTPGPWQDTPRVRGSAQVHSETFRVCVATMAQYVYDTYGKFPGTVPSVFVLTYLQAHHLDLAFYDAFFPPGAYLSTHAQHMANWHEESEK